MQPSDAGRALYQADTTRGSVRACFKHGGGRRCGVPIDEGPCANLASTGGRCDRHGGGSRGYCLHPTPSGPCQNFALKKDGRCHRHGGAQRCLHPTPNGPCQTFARRGGKCYRHGGGRARCLHPTPSGPCQKFAQSGGKCCRHGGGRRCLHPTPTGPCQNIVQSNGTCVAHGGGPCCKSEACVGLTSPPFAGYRSSEGQPLCWGCFTAQYPERAKLKVRSSWPSCSGASPGWGSAPSN